MRSILFAAAFAFAAPVLAHEAETGWKYDNWCCGGQDCTHIHPHTVRVVEGGYIVTLTPEDHMTARRDHQKFFRSPDADPSNDKDMNPPEARWSQDSDYHACILPNSQELRCLYVPQTFF